LKMQNDHIAMVSLNDRKGYVLLNGLEFWEN